MRMKTSNFAPSKIDRGLQTKQTNTVKMEEKEKWTKLSMVDMDIRTNGDEFMGRVIRGKMIYTPATRLAVVVENRPRIRRLEVGRTAHGRITRGRQGGYTVTLRVTGGERQFKAMMIAEIRSAASQIAKDYEIQGGAI